MPRDARARRACQVMKTCESLRAEGFNSVTTIEFRLRSINHCEIKLQVPDFGSPLTSSRAAPAAAETSPDVVEPIDGGGKAAPVGAGDQAPVDHRPQGDEESGATTKKGGNQEEAEAEGSAAPGVASAAAPALAAGSATDGVGDDEARKSASASPAEAVSGAASGSDAGGTGGGERTGQTRNGQDAANDPAEDRATSNKRPREPDTETAANGARKRPQTGGGSRRPSDEQEGPEATPRPLAAPALSAPQKMLCAQPYQIMRGHTAFLTFATTPVSRRETHSAGASTQGATRSGGAVDGADAGECDSGVGPEEGVVQPGPGEASEEESSRGDPKGVDVQERLPRDEGRMPGAAAEATPGR